MSEEIKNEEGLNPEVAEAVQPEEAAEAAETAEAVTEEATVDAADGSQGESVEAAESAQPEVSESEETAQPEVSETEEAAQPEDAETADDGDVEVTAYVDLSHMSWEDRVSYYQSLGTVDGYVEALRLVDFHNPEDIQIAEVWGAALAEHPEFARAIFDKVSRLVTSSAETWGNILESHAIALESASDEGQAAIGEVIGLIQCLRAVDVEAGKERLAAYPTSAEVIENLAIVATGNWRKVEIAVEAQVKAAIADEAAAAVETAHRVADYALSAGALDRAVEMMRRTSRKFTDDLSVKWRLAILSRDQKKWPGYVDVLSKELINSTDRIEQKVDIYQEMIRVYRDETKQEPQVVKTYEALLAVDPTNSDALASLVEIYEKMRKWPDLVKVLDAQAEASEGDAKVDYYLRIAKIYLEKMSRKMEAIKYFENVLSVDPVHSESLEQLKALYTERRDWEKLIDVHRKELGLIDNVDEQISLIKSMADLAKTKMRNNGVAIDMWNLVLERDSENAEALQALESLYEGEKRWADLAAIIERKISLMTDEKAQFAELQKLGMLYSDKAGDNVSAIATWRRVLAIDPSYSKGVDSLRKLLIEERDWTALEEYYAENGILPDLVKLFEQLSKSLKDDADKKAVLLRAADVYEKSLGDSDKAMATLEKILEIDAKDAVAAGALVPYYESRGKYEELAKMLAILHDSLEAGEERSAYGLRLAKLYETKLSDDRHAYEWYLKTVKEDIRYTQAFDGLERSSGKTGHAQQVVDLFNKHLAECDDAEFVRELKYRIGCLDLEYLEKADEAQKIFEELLADNAEDVRALGALERILEREGRFNELLEINERRMKLAKTPEDMAETLLSGARIHEGHLGDKAGAIESYERVCELLPEDTRPLVELHRLYAETESYESLARVIEKQLELMDVAHAFSEVRSEAEVNEEGVAGVVYGARLERREDGTAEWVERTVHGLDPESAIALWFELGEVYRKDLLDYDASVRCYDNILLLNPEHAESIAALESLLENGVSAETVCRALSKVYALQENYEKLQDVLIKLADNVIDSRDKMSYLICASQINSEILDNSDGALDCMARALAADPASVFASELLKDAAVKYDCWERVIHMIEDVGNSISAESEPQLATQYALDLGNLWEVQLENRDKAIEYGQRALAIGKSNPDVINYLKETFQRLESWKDVIAVLRAEGELTEDDAALLDLNMQIASIYEINLDKKDAAIDTLTEVLEKHPENMDAMDALDRLYVASERWEEAVSNCERRLELVEDTAKRDEIECHMASILSEHLNEVDRAFDIYSNILSHDAQNEMAVEGLERMLEANEGAIVEQITELLLPIYDATDKWEKRCWADEQLLRVVPDPDRRRDLLHEIAGLYEQRGGDHEKAYDAFARSLKEDLRSQDTIDQLFNYADVLDKWGELVKVMEAATTDSDDPEAARTIRGMAAEIYREHLDDVDSAIATYESIREQAPEDVEVLNALEDLYRGKESWKSLAEVLMAKAKLATEPEERKALLFQAASLNEEILGDVDAAIAIHTDILADEAGEPTALDCLERLYKGKEAWNELLGVLTSKNEIAEDDDTRKSIYYQMGELQETKLNDIPGAIETYRSVLSIDAEDAQALEALDRLYLANGDMASLLDILQQREAIAQDDESRVNFKFRQAECRFRSLDDCMGAIEDYRAVFEIDPAHEASIASLEEIVKIGGEPAVEAAKVLQPVYQGLEKWPELVKVYEVLAAGSEDMEELISLLGTIGTIQEEMLESPKDAFDAWFRALSHDATRDASWEKVEALADTCDCNAELVEKLDALIPELSGDADSAIIVAKHLAKIHEEKLAQPEKAIEALQRVREMDSNDVEAIHGLDHLYESLEKWTELAELLHTEIDIAETDDERLNSYYRLGAVQEMYLHNYEEAVSSYNEMHMIVPGQPEAIESLHRIFDAGQCCASVAEILESYYRGIEDWEKLVDLDLKFVDHIEEHDARYDKFIEIADVYLNQLQMIPEGLAIYGRALTERPGDDLCLAKIDELSDVLQDWSNNVAYYQNAINACEDDEIKKDLTLRMARTCDEHLGDYENAEKYYLGVLGFDAEHLPSLEALDRIYAGQERWEDLVAIIRREIPIVDTDDAKIQLYMRLGAVLNDVLGKGDEAIAAYKDILDIEPSYWDALVALEGIYQGREDWTSLCDIFEKEAAVSNDDNQRVELWGKMAHLNSEILNKTDEAVDLWYQVIGVLGDNLVSLQNLEVLFVRTERWADMADVVERQLPLCVEDPALHIETYRKLGRVYRDKLEDNERSLDYWKQALTDDPNDLESLRAIEALDEAIDDQEDLAVTLRQILASGQLQLEDQLACAIKLAGVLDGLGRVDDTIEIWNYVLDLDGTHIQALNELERLYEGEGRWEDVVNTLKRKINVTDDLEQKIELWQQIAKIWETQVGDIDNAADAYQNILELDPNRDAIFETLEELYTNYERWQDLPNVYMERADVVAERDQQMRLNLLFKASKVAEEKLDNADTAFLILQTAILDHWKNEQLHAELERLAEKTGKWNDLVLIYEGMIEEATVPADMLALHNTVARWYFHHLHDNSASWQHFEYVRSLDPNNIECLEAMSEIFYRLGEWDQLIGTLGRRLELTTVTDDRVTLFLELAKVFEEKKGDIGQAIDFYIQAFRLNEQRLDVMKELARIYETAEQWPELVDILERELAVIEDPEDKINVQYKVGVVQESCLENNEKASDAYQAVLALDQTHADALRACERMDIALERWTDILKIYELQLAAFYEPAEQMDIYSKVSRVYEEHFDDLEHAIENMIQVTLIDSAYVPAIQELERLYEKAGRWQDLIDTLTVHINTVPDTNEHIELYRKLGVVYRDNMQDAYHSGEAFQNLISISPSDVPALYALADLYEAAEDYISAIQYLNEVVASISDNDEATDVHYRVGQIFTQKLEDDASAEERFKICLDINAAYMPAIDALAEMYERHEDWQNLIKILKQKVDCTRELDQKAQINCKLGDVSLHKIDDPVNAYAYYNEALSQQPECTEAAFPLAEKCLVDKAYARALLLYDIVIRHSSYVSDASQLYELNYKAGYCCQNLSQHEKALEYYRASYELNQDYAPTLLGMGEELLEAKDYDRSYKMFQNVLERFSDQLTHEQIIQIYYDSAVAKKEVGEYALAREHLARILEADGSQTKSLELIIDVCDEMGDWEALIYYMSIHMDRQEDSDVKFDELMKIAQVFETKIGDPDRQIETYYRALEVKPGSRIVLNHLLNIYNTTGQWENAIDIINRICESEEDPEKIARYYYTIGVIYRDELNIDNMAVEYFNKTLDTNVGELRAFEAIDRILTASRDWESLESNYLAMIKRVYDDGSEEFNDTKKLLWYSLGEIYRTRLQEWDHAIDAFKKASELSPKDEKLHIILAELYVRMPIEDYGRDAIEEIRTIIDLQGNNATPEQERQNYRSLFFLYHQLHDYDRAWCITDITVAKNYALQDEVDHHDNLDSDMLAGALPRLTEDQLKKFLYHPKLNGDLTKLFMLYQQCLRPAFCHKDKDEGISKRHPVKPNQDMPFWKIYSNSARAIGVTMAPDVYQCAFLTSGMRLANVDYNAFKVAPDMFSGRDIPEWRFIISRNLMLFQTFFMAGIALGASALKALIIASVGYMNGKPPIDVNQQNIYNALKNVPRSLQDELRRQLDVIITKGIDLNASAWLKAVDLTCDRCGLLLCADYESAVMCIRRDDAMVSKLTADERIAELTRFAMSDEYFALRNILNIKNYNDSEDEIQ